MSSEKIKKRVLANTFVDRVLSEMYFDDVAYKDLTEALTELAATLRGATALEREIALVLYSIPLMTRNAFLSLSEHTGKTPPIAAQLEDAWVELDALVTNCLTDPV